MMSRRAKPSSRSPSPNNKTSPTSVTVPKLEEQLAATEKKLEDTTISLNAKIADLESRVASLEQSSAAPATACALLARQAKRMLACLPPPAVVPTESPPPAEAEVVPEQVAEEEKVVAEPPAVAAEPAAAPTPAATAPSLRVIISGGPASGKGTQCEKLVAKYAFVHLSTGDMLRAAVNAGTEVGLEAKACMERGELVPDSIITKIVLEALSADYVKDHWLLDGFPRTVPQADALTAAGVVPTHVICLEVPDDTLVERVSTRRQDPVTGKIYNIKSKPPESEEVAQRLVQRADDTEEAVRKRLATFHANEAALEHAYESLLTRLDGTQHPDAVFEAVSAVFI